VPRFLIESDLTGAGQLSADDLRGISRKSCSVLRRQQRNERNSRCALRVFCALRDTH
jgi:hypothetical protein